MSSESESLATDELAATLAPLVARLNTALRRQTMDAGLTLAQARALATLRDGGPHRITDLAALEQVAQPSMTALVSRMERQGWVRRVPDPTDARCVRVEVTQPGLEVLGRVSAARAAILAGRLAAIGPDERAALAAALPVLQKLMSQEQ